MEKVVFKKYKNRKIYNVTESRYSTLEDVFRSSGNGSVTVTDAVTGEDITNETILLGAVKTLTPAGLEILVSKARFLASPGGGDGMLIATEEEVEEVAKEAIEFAEEVAADPSILFAPPTVDKNQAEKPVPYVGTPMTQLPNNEGDEEDLFASKES